MEEKENKKIRETLNYMKFTLLIIVVETGFITGVLLSMLLSS